MNSSLYKIIRILKNLLVITAVSGIISSCEKFVDVPPPVNEVLGTTVFENNETALSVLNGMYSNLMRSGLPFGNGGVTFCSGLTSDEFQNFSFASDNIEISVNQIQSANGTIKELWSDIFYTIYTCNSILKSVPVSDKLSVSVKQQLIGESLFIRAFCNFYLTNFWGDAPLALSTDYRETGSLPRTDRTIIEEQMMDDLKQASEILTQEYPTQGRVRPNRLAAKALLARVCLYTKMWQEAIQYSSDVIDNASLYQLEQDLDQVFINESREAIFQLMPTRPGSNTNEASAFILTDVPQLVSLRKSVADDFEIGDKRRKSWIGEINVQNETFYYPAKYKIITSDPPIEYYVLLRFAEQYLIRAEARIEMNDLNGGLADLNRIRIRAGLELLPDNLNKEECLAAMMKERKRELFAEWGHRWFDLLRTGNANKILGPIKSQWSETDQLYPIPQSEILLNNNLIQNPGY